MTKQNKTRRDGLVKFGPRRTDRIITFLGLGGCVGLLAIMLIALVPAVTLPTFTYATMPCENRECDATMSIQTDVNVATVISLGLDSEIAIDLVPQSSGSFAEETTRLTVATNSPEGYSLYMQSVDGTSQLRNVSAPQVSSTINPVEGTVTKDTFSSQPNTWGYSLDSTSKTYRAVPTSQSLPIKVTNTKAGVGDSNIDAYDLSFGVAIDTNLEAGTYSNEVIVSAVANPVTITNLYQLVYMQDMTAEICTNTPYDKTGATSASVADLHNPVTKQLIDTRDGKKYWVAKLADGNCWMTQNLALDITEAMANATGNSGLLNSTTTDIGYNTNGELIDGIKYWNKDSEYGPVETNKYKLDGTSYDHEDIGDMNSWNFGEVAYAVPNYAIDNGVGNNLNNPALCHTAEKFYDDWDSATQLSGVGQQCQDVGFFDVGDWLPTYVAGRGTIKLGNGVDYQGLVTLDEESERYDAHYLLGDYYAYGALTAGSGLSITQDANASDSICPKGWRLPVVEASMLGFNTSGNYSYLLRQYGLATSYDYGPAVVNGYTVADPPLSFIFAGVANSWTGTLREMGVRLLYRGATYAEKDRMFIANPVASNPAHGGYGLEYGVPARCLAR